LEAALVVVATPFSWQRFCIGWERFEALTLLQDIGRSADTADHLVGEIPADISVDVPLCYRIVKRLLPWQCGVSAVKMWVPQ
jgi:hypothetical protein